MTDGRKVWSRQAYADFGALEGYFGAGSTPIVAGDRLLVNVGSRRGAGLVAFALETGETVWKATNDGASYSSPTSATIDGLTSVVFVTRENVVGIDPKSGAVRFSFPFGRRGATVNAATPLVLGDRLFVSAAYGVGAVLADIRSGGFRKIWANDRTMSSQYSTCVYHEGYLYGTHGREDVGVAKLRSIEAATGKIAWSVDDFGVASIIFADEKLLIMKTSGELILAKPSPDGFKKIASARVSTNITRALPALSVGRFFLRDQAPDGGTLICLEVGQN